MTTGLLVEESHRRLGMFTVRRYRPTPSAGHDQVVARLRSVLLGESLPDERTAPLISLLAAGHKLRYLVPKKSSREALRRAEEEALGRIGEDERALVSAVGAAVTRAHDASN